MNHFEGRRPFHSGHLYFVEAYACFSSWFVGGQDVSAKLVRKTRMKKCFNRQDGETQLLVGLYTNLTVDIEVSTMMIDGLL